MTVSISHYFIPLFELVVKINVFSDSFDFKKNEITREFYLLSSLENAMSILCYQKHCFSNVASKNCFHTINTQSLLLNTILV